MDTRQIEYAVAVAEELNFTRAAQRVFAVQSTVSVGVRALESELGVALFDRDKRGVRITSTGEAVLPLLREFLAAGERIRTAVDPAGGLRGELRVGVFAHLGYLDLPSVIGAFHQRHPLVDLRLRPSRGGSSELAEDVRRGRLDLAFFGLPPSSAPGLETRLIVRSPFVAVLPLGHPLSDAQSVAVQDLSRESFVEAPDGFGPRVVLDAALRGLGVTRVIATEIGELGAIPAFVEAGLGVAVIPEIFITDRSAAVSVRPLSHPIDWDFNAVTRPHPSPAARVLLEAIVSSATRRSAAPHTAA
ncbi:LysR family transcriptional regulator [Microbacterium soli]